MRTQQRQPTTTAKDGLPALVVGAWAREKQFYVRRAADIFSTGMKSKWPSRCFIDVFSGPGRCVIEDTDDELDGSPIQALTLHQPFSHYVFNDMDPDKTQALEKRVTAMGVEADVTFITLDCNEAVAEIRAAVPSNALSLAFIDGWNWEMRFESLDKLTAGLHMDLLINVPVPFMKRNWRHDLPALDAFLGGNGYRADFELAMERDRRAATRIILDYYGDNLRAIGYEHTSDDRAVVTTSRNVKLYQLVYASRHPLGESFWEKVTARTAADQIRMNM